MVNKVEYVHYRMKDGVQHPKQMDEDDFGTDIYLAEDTLLVPSMLEANLVGTGLHTEFNPKEYGMLVVPRSSMSLLPISMANHIGVIEGSYRGEIKVPLRNTLTRESTDFGKFNYILEWDEPTKKLVKLPGDKVDKELWEDMRDKLKEEAETYFLGSNTDSLGAKYKLREGSFPKGTILMRAGTRIAQVFLAPKLPIYWVETEELSETKRGTGGFGSSNGAS